MTDPALLAALGAALENDPRNGALWLHYAELLEGAGRADDALAALRTAVELADVRERALRRLLPLLRAKGLVSEALVRAEAWLEHHDDPAIAAELERIQAARAGGTKAARSAPPRPVEPGAEDEPEPEEREPALVETRPAPASDEDWAAQFDWGDLRVSFDDVAGLEEVKRQIRLRIVAPFKDPSIYDAFGRQAGGGILLYGPPGCGKTFVARATAGELGARFVSVSIHDVLDKYWGESEKLVHALFEQARRTRPTVLFFDEFDALGSVRGRGEGQLYKTLVDQLLQEMDGVGSRNRDVLLVAATNVPWNVDPAFRRPGRFDRVLFVTPPDADARRAILERHLKGLPGGAELDVSDAVRRTEGWSGADLRALAERTGEDALERSLESGTVHRVARADLERALAKSRGTVLEWLATARNHARYANEGGQYDELVDYLKRAKRW